MFIIQLADRFAFCHKTQKANGTFNVIPLASLVTPYGFMIPSSRSAFNLLDLLEGVETNVADYNTTAAYFIDAKGVARDVLIHVSGSYYRRLPTNYGSFSVRAQDGDLELAILAAYELFPDSLEDIVKAVLNTYPAPADSVTYISIDEIKTLLKGKRLKPIIYPPVKPLKVKE